MADSDNWRIIRTEMMQQSIDIVMAVIVLASILYVIRFWNIDHHKNGNNEVKIKNKTHKK